MQDDQTVINTDPVFEESSGKQHVIEKVQFDFRDFAFWEDDAVSRAVGRYQFELRSGAIHDPLNVIETSLNPDGWTTCFSKPNAAQEPVLELPAVFRKRTIGDRSVNTLQEWECVVDRIEDGTVYAAATSVICAEPEQNYIDVPLVEFQPSDRERVKPGVVFRLIIGFVTKPNGRRSREAILYIRDDLPRIDRDIDSLLEVLSED